jgi:hypothetical protein
MAEYHYKLLAMGPAGDSAQTRVHFVNPEKIKNFETHNMALSSLVLYSPACLARIKRLISGRDAYILSGIVCREDLTLAHELGMIMPFKKHSIYFSCIGVPLLGSEPGISHLYTTKAGARHLFTDAGVAIPPYEADIFSKGQLLERLAFLIANNPQILRWVFKLPEQTGGRGFGNTACNVTIDNYDCAVV